MATIKSYTDLSQSKVLAKILPIDSADMYYTLSEDNGMYMIGFGKPNKYPSGKIQICWSLAALLSVLPKINGLNPILDLEENSIQYTGIDLYVVADNPVDACYEMIVKLNELKML